MHSVVNMCVLIASPDVRDLWLSSEVKPLESSVKFESVCPASNLKISASLCWRQHEHLCTPVLNSTLEETGEDLVSLAGLLLLLVIVRVLKTNRALSNTHRVFSTDIQHNCGGQTPSDVCAGENKPNVRALKYVLLFWLHVHIFVFDLCSFLYEAAIMSLAHSRLVSQTGGKK